MTRPKQQDVGALFEPRIAGRQRHHLRLRDHRHDSEVKGRDGFPRWQLGFPRVPFGAAADAVGHLKFGQRRQEPGRRPAFLVGLCGELGPHQFDAGQAQLAEQQFNACGVDGVGRTHAATCKVGVAVTATTATNSS